MKLKEYLEEHGMELMRVEHDYPRGTLAVIRSKETGNAFVGISKCNPSDTWDYEVGTVVAVSRALDEYRASVARQARALSGLMTTWHGTTNRWKQEREYANVRHFLDEVAVAILETLGRSIYRQMRPVAQPDEVDSSLDMLGL